VLTDETDANLQAYDADNRRETRQEALLVERPVHRPYQG